MLLLPRFRLSLQKSYGLDVSPIDVKDSWTTLFDGRSGLTFELVFGSMDRCGDRIPSNVVIFYRSWRVFENIAQFGWNYEWLGITFDTRTDVQSWTIITNVTLRCKSIAPETVIFLVFIESSLILLPCSIVTKVCVSFWELPLKQPPTDVLIPGKL